MTSLPPSAPQGLQKHACSLCARRKVKCDKAERCSNCTKARAQCSYEAPAAYQPRKRAADEDLLHRLSLYEDLMRKHDVDFSHCANTWVPNGLETKLEGGDAQSPVAALSATSRPTSKGYPTGNTESNLKPCLWSTMSSELKYLPTHTIRCKHESLQRSTPYHQFFSPSTGPELYKLHPEPKHIYRFWQIFVERVNPLTKVIHVPTLQQRISDASWDLENVSRPLTAIMFAVYSLAVTSMPSDECQSTFGEARDTLLATYRTASLRALIASDVFTTRELEVLQAFALFLFADPDSDFTTTLSGAAIRLAQKMGLHRENKDPKICFFEKEMRIRLWWQLCARDSMDRATPGSKSPSDYQVRLPLNVNDADLHPDMMGPPIEHHGPTEMICVLIKIRVAQWIQCLPAAVKIFGGIAQWPGKSTLPTKEDEEAINELQAIYNEPFFRNRDIRIPLHEFTHITENIAIARTRFKLRHPRRRATANDGEVFMPREEGDVLFESAVLSLEMADLGRRSKFSWHLLSRMTPKFHLDVYIYVISDLRRRGSGNRVALAWKLVSEFYNEHPELIQDSDNSFFAALGDLTLEAWETRREELVRGQDIWQSEVTPQFIQSLLDKRRSGNEVVAPMPVALDTGTFDAFTWTDDNDPSFYYWDDFLRS